jgi:hypothetical protein
MMRWVSLLLEGTRAVVTFNGHRSRPFAVRRGCAQGSPLSPLLYVMSAQPLAAMCHQLVRLRRVQPRCLPGGEGAASPVQQHADDTTLHAKSPADAGVLMQEAVRPFCDAATAEVSLQKCWGLDMGSQQPVHGLHAGTGVVFRPPGEAVRHLGVPLVVGDPTVAVQRVFRSKLQAVYTRIRHWQRFDLTAVGRAHVAKQVLASVFSYHATFLPVPEAELTAITRAIKGFVWGNRLVQDEGDAQAGAWLGTAHATLPQGMGGIGLVDLPVFVRALQAKVAAMLMHPRRVPWKLYMRFALRRQFPGLGMAVLVQRSMEWPRAHQLQQLSQRHQEYAKAFRHLPLVRSAAHRDMSPQQVRLEPLLGNDSVAGEDGRARWRRVDLPAQLRQVSTLGQVPVAFRGAFKLPPAWGPLLGAPDIVEWEVEVGGRWVRRQAPAGQGAGHEVHAVQPSGLVGARLTLLPAAPGYWLSACVVEIPHPKQSREKQLWVVGAWQAVSVDPSVWAVGGTPVLQYTVRDATRAMLVPHGPDVQDWALRGRGVRPKVWGPPGAGGCAGPATADALQVIHDRQVQRLGVAREGAAGSRGGRRARAFLDVDFTASWMLPSPPRQPALDRARSSAAVAEAARQQHRLQLQQITQPTVDDTQWEVAPVPLWAAAWRRAAHQRLPRDTQVFGWRLLHASLAVGGRRIVTLPAGSPELDGCLCQAPCCVGREPRPLETLLHLYTECAVGKAAVAWLRRIWMAIDGGGHQLPSPLDHRVVIADDGGVWQPRQELYPLWTLLRLTMLKAVWKVRCAFVQGRGQYSAAAVAAVFVREVSALIRQDWACVEGDVRLVAGVPPSWFRGRETAVTEERFRRDWCVHTGVLAVIVQAPGGGRQLEIRLRPDWRVQLPGDDDED